MVEGHGSVWVASRHTDTVYRIDPTSNQITAKIAVGDEPSFLVDDGTAVWVAEFGSQALGRIDPVTNVVTQVGLPAELGGWPVAGRGAIWQGTSAGIVEVDTKSRTIVGSIKQGGPSGVAFASGLVWTAQPSGKGIQRVDPTTLTVRDVVAPGTDASGMIASDGSVFWASDGQSVARLDLRTGRVLGTYPLPAGIDGGMAVLSGGRIWITQPYPLAFAGIDAKTGRLGPMESLPNATTYALYFLDRGPHDLWISDWDNNVIYRVDPTR